MNILMYLPTLELGDGISTYAINFYRALKKHYGEKVKIDFAVLYFRPGLLVDEVKKNNSKVFSLPSIKHYSKFKQALHDIYSKNNYDLLECNMINSGAFVLGEAKKYGIKHRILHVHSTSNGDSFVKRLVRLPFKYLALNYANALFACSNAAGNYFFNT